MPWKETNVMDQRIQFIAAVKEDPRGNFKRLCERFGISRAKGYKWLERYGTLGPAGLFYGPLLLGYVLRRDGTYRIERPD